MFWAYTICWKRTRESRNTLQDRSLYSPSIVMLEERGIFDYFTHFELLETNVLYDLYSDIAFIATNEFKRNNLTIDRAFASG
jgi:hypothetical protein